MKQLIFLDAKTRPDLFVWNGPADPFFLRKWLAEHNWQKTPEDLFVLWQKTGGGDIYETETILGPSGDSDTGDNLLEVNNDLHRHGMQKKYLVFHRGLDGFTAVRLTDGKYVQLSEGDFYELAEYTSFDEWYRMLRGEYADRYEGLTFSSQVRISA